jgi:hypothetical protein
VSLSLLGLLRVFEKWSQQVTLHYLNELRQVVALFKVVRVHIKIGEFVVQVKCRRRECK